MSRAEIFIWMTAISLITFVSTVFLTGIIVDDLVTPKTSLDCIKEISSIFTSLLAIPLTIYGLFLARDGLSTWEKQLKTDKTITALENAMNEVDNIMSTCLQAENLQEILFENINFTQSDNTFNDTDIDSFKNICSKLSQLANRLQNICNKPLVDAELKAICNPLVVDSNGILILSIMLDNSIMGYQKIRSERFEPKNIIIYPVPDRAGITEILKIQEEMLEFKKELKRLKTTSLQTKSTLNNFHFK